MLLRDQISRFLTQRNRESAVALTQFTRRANCLLMFFSLHFGDYLKLWLQLPPCAWSVTPVSRTRQIQIAPQAANRGVLPECQERGLNNEL